MPALPSCSYPCVAPPSPYTLGSLAAPVLLRLLRPYPSLAYTLGYCCPCSCGCCAAPTLPCLLRQRIACCSAALPAAAPALLLLLLRCCPWLRRCWLRCPCCCGCCAALPPAAAAAAVLLPPLPCLLPLLLRLLRRPWCPAAAPAGSPAAALLPLQRLLRRLQGGCCTGTLGGYRFPARYPPYYRGYR